MDIYIHDTMYVVSWQILVVVGGLVLSMLVAVVLLVAWALRGDRRKP